jgi:nucleotide-binding universal stress UspA family protein
MAKRILVPVDGSDQSRAACEFVFQEFPDATLHLLHVINPAEAGYTAQANVPSFSEEWYEQATDQAEDIFDDVRQNATEHGFGGDIETATEVGRPSRVIVDQLEDEETAIDHLVMGSHGRSGVTRILLGSVAEAVMRRSPVPVTVVR